MFSNSFFFFSCRECEVFSKNHPAPFSKVITFHKKEPFDLEAFYSSPQELPYPDHRIGTGADSAAFAENRNHTTV